MDKVNGAPTQKNLKEFGGQFGGKMKLEDTPPRLYGRPPNFGGYFLSGKLETSSRVFYYFVQANLPAQQISRAARSLFLTTQNR